MRSIRYILKTFITGTRNPHNLDDCLDFSQKEMPLKITLLSLDARTYGFVTDFGLETVTELLGIFQLKFLTKDVIIEQYHGKISRDSTEKYQELQVDKANESLKNWLEKLENMGEVIGKEQRFDYSLLEG